MEFVSEPHWASPSWFYLANPRPGREGPVYPASADQCSCPSWEPAGPSPPLHQGAGGGSSLGKCSHRTSAPNVLWDHGRGQLASQLVLLGGPFSLPDGDPAGPLPWAAESAR